MKKLFTSLEASEILGISLQGVHYRIKKKQLKSLKKNGKVFVYLDDKEIKKLDEKKSTNNNQSKKTTNDNPNNNNNELINSKDDQIKFLQKYIKWIKKQHSIEILRIEKNQKRIIEVFNSEIKLLQQAFNEMKNIYNPKVQYTMQINNDFLTLREFFNIMKKFDKTEQEIKQIIFNAVKNNDRRFIYIKEEKKLLIIKSNFDDLV